MVDIMEQGRAETKIDLDARRKPVEVLPTIEEEDSNTADKHSKAYNKELQEIREGLPDEIKDFADIFCSED
jgi:ferritin-like protein